MSSPLFQSLLLVTHEDVILWMHIDKINPELIDHFQVNHNFKFVKNIS